MSVAAPTSVMPFQVVAGGVLLHVRLTPRGGRDSLDGVTAGADGKTVLQARVKVVPENGEANAALIALLAKSLGLKKSAFDLTSGATSRHKTLRISGDPQVLSLGLASICRS